MLIVNNKALKITNKWLNPVAGSGPTPPGPTPPGPDLLYTQAVISTTDTVGQTTTLMSGHTWDTAKNFICYKMSVRLTPHSAMISDAKYRAMKLTDGTGNWNDLYFGRVCGIGLSVADNSAFLEPLYYNNNIYGTVGSSGASSLIGGGETVFISNPNTLMSDSDQTEFKIIFDKTLHKLYGYIEGKQVEVVDYSSLSIDMSTWPITNVYMDRQSTATTYNFGIDVYACDSLVEAEGV